MEAEQNAEVMTRREANGNQNTKTQEIVPLE